MNLSWTSWWGSCWVHLRMNSPYELLLSCSATIGILEKIELWHKNRLERFWTDTMTQNDQQNDPSYLMKITCKTKWPYWSNIVRICFKSFTTVHTGNITIGILEKSFGTRMTSRVWESFWRPSQEKWISFRIHFHSIALLTGFPTAQILAPTDPHKQRNMLSKGPLNAKNG